MIMMMTMMLMLVKVMMIMLIMMLLLMMLMVMMSVTMLVKMLMEKRCKGADAASAHLLPAVEWEPHWGSLKVGTQTFSRLIIMMMLMLMLTQE